MLGLFKRFFDYNEREIQRLRKKVDEINNLDGKARKLKDEDFKSETEKLKKSIREQKQSLDDVLPWAYALSREAARRVLGERHYDVQLIAGIALHEGKVVEQKTGEGKTLTATAALYLNALTGRGVHLVTVNDYLARRDAGWMGRVFHMLGVSTAAMIADTSFIFDPEHEDKDAQDWRLVHLRPISRKEAYLADITYGINSEFGFDYLRDNMVQSADQMVQRGYYFAVIDEADSVLIDEARTPHIISAPYDEDVSKYYRYAQIVKRLKSGEDYLVDEKLKTANLTEPGIQNIESALGVSNIYEKDFDTLFHIEAALKAETLFKNDKEYIVKDGEVIIVDEFTGRLLQGRRFSEGLHQAIEAKENVSIQKDSKTLATVSLQNYFRMYEKLAGMTGTAMTEAEEFHKIYKTDVLAIPTHRQMIRKDHPDMIYKTERTKFNAVVEEVAEHYKTGRPVLVGTTSIEKNEHLSKLLRQRGIPHQLLNAKNHIQEAKILAEAGEKGTITVATNMAGRGVDILLGGMPPNADILKDKTGKISEKKQKEFDREKHEWQEKHDEVVSLGGLYVIGTERHESRRIDNQLRGRSGRQGDPGETRFFVSLEDDLMRIFGGEQIAKLMTFLNFPEDQPLSHGMVSKAIEQSQVKVEGFNFDIRKHLVEFDDVLNKQREIVYTLRKKLVAAAHTKKDEFKETLSDIFHEQIAILVNSFVALKEASSEEEFDSMKKELYFTTPQELDRVHDLIRIGDQEALQEYLEDRLWTRFTEKQKKVGSEAWLNLVKFIYLSTIDQYWTEHLTAIEDLREGINLRGYGQLDPLVEYKNEAYSMFEKLITDIYFEATRRVFTVEVQLAEPAWKEPEEKKMILQSASRIDPFRESERQKEVEISQSSSELVKTSANLTNSNKFQPISTSEIEGFKVIPPGTAHKKLGRNDPCWCGSGKKYKKCHWPDGERIF